MRRRTLKALLAGALLPPGGIARAGETFKLVSISPLTGALSTGLQPSKMVDGMRLAVDDLNAGGGLLGRRIELLILDSQSQSLQARAAAREAVALKPLAVIGERVSSLSLAIAPVLQQARVVMISPVSSHADLTAVGDYVFRMCSSDLLVARVLGEFARAELRSRRAAVLVNISQQYSQALGRLFTVAYKSGGGQVVFEGEYLQDKADFRALLERARVAQPDLLFVPGYVKDVGVLMRQAREMGLTQTFLSGDGLGPLEEYGGPAVHGSFHVVSWQRDEPHPASRDFVQRFERRYGTVRSEAVALAYDAVMVLADAVRRAGSAAPALVRQELARTPPLQGVTGMLSFDRERNAVRQVRIVKVGPSSQTVVKVFTPAPAGSAR